MTIYKMVASMSESTVVAEYVPEGKKKDISYQSEAVLEQQFIEMLSEQGYDHLTINDEATLINNLRSKLEYLNKYQFTDSEWKRFLSDNLANQNDGIVEKTRKIQDDYVQVLKRDNGTSKNIYLIDKVNIHNNSLQVINQYEEGNGVRDNRYDVSILVNGLPLVHVELKRRGVSIKEAFNQIDRYQRDSFWASSGLYEYVQIFVISNGTNTKYYSNTTREGHIKEYSMGERNKSRKTSNSFEFTSYWADGNNKIIPDLVDFTSTFFAKHTILNILTKYCVFTSENMLLVMRPYQIVATERIVNRIEVANNYKKMGTIDAGGYIWHTTGSGKTLTSFKTAQLAAALPYIEKVLFVVDRKDLDYQTMKEYDRFQVGAANGNTSTMILQQQLEDTTSRIIITTIQKLNVFISKNKEHKIYKKHVVIIFDECHRSQFGEMHQKIIKYFKNYHLFGFTGTPIFAANANMDKNLQFVTTEQAFGEKLHTYTIVDAIKDGNVLPFRIDYVNTIKESNYLKDAQVSAIDTEKALAASERITAVTKYVIDHFDQKTKRGFFYNLKSKKFNGFNSIFAVSSIQVAKQYYVEFKKQLKEQPNKMKIAIIFSFCPNEEEPDGILEEEEFETEQLDKSSRDFLDDAIRDYNDAFHTNFDSSSEKFQNYYKDLSQRVKNREVDLLIVVNMFLTGFDATTLNTLWVDKNLKQHGLIQAFSRTNRILNSVKTFGNIVCFRNLQQETDDAIALFGDENAKGIVLLKSYREYYNGYNEGGQHYNGYKELIDRLLEDYSLSSEIIGEKAQKEFVRLFGTILRMRNILSAFDQFENEMILTDREYQDYQSRYIDIYQLFKNKDRSDREIINDDLVFEVELVKQVEVNIDYILMLVAKYHDGNCQDANLLLAIRKAIDSSLQLRSKKELIENFIAVITVATDVNSDWARFVSDQEEKELDDLISQQNLKPEETLRYMNNSFHDGELKTLGTDIDSIMPSVSRFTNDNSRENKKNKIIEELKKFFEKYSGIYNYNSSNV